MEANESGLSSYFHHNHSTTISSSNGILPSTDRSSSHMLYPNPVPSAVSSPLRRKRGRPRKYGTPEQAAAAKRLSSSSNYFTPKRKEQSLGTAAASTSTCTSTSSKKYTIGNVGQAFTPHIINVIAGEDVGQKIMMFMQQSKCEICILSASGSISNASLRQPATSGGNITYEGQFDIISLCGSYVRTELGGRTGGLSVCLSSTDGQIIGGGVGGPLTAVGPVQVIVGAFVMGTKKDMVNENAPASWLPSPVPNAAGGFMAATIDTSGNQQNIVGEGQYIIQSSDWRTGTDTRNNNMMSYEFTGRIGSGGGHESPENGEWTDS